MKADKRLYLNADRSKVVEEGDPEAAYLFAAEGAEVPDAEAKKYGLMGEKPKEPEPAVVHSSAADPEPAEKPKAAAKAENK